MKMNFNRLTELVILEVLAALPMEQVLRMMLIGCPRLGLLSARKWVTDRMSDVRFDIAVRASWEHSFVKKSLNMYNLHVFFKCEYVYIVLL